MAALDSTHPRIAVLLPDLRPGGAERVHIILAREWLKRGCEVDFILCRRVGRLLSEVPDGAKVYDLGAKRVRYAIVPLIRYLRTRRPAVLLSAMWPLTAITPIVCWLSRVACRTAISEHGILSAQYESWGRIHRALMRSSIFCAYRWVDARIAVSHGVAADIAGLSRMPDSAFSVIYNPAASGEGTRSKAPPGIHSADGSLILSVGALKAVKDHKTLIQAFALVAMHKPARLCILGEGPLRAELEDLISRLGISDRVLLPGHRNDTAPWYASASLFVLSSRHEGFGNVIAEAMEYGVPVVSTDCPSGPGEILCNGKYGELVPVGNIRALADAICRALAAEHDPEQLKTRAREFLPGRIACEYIDALLPDFRVG